MTAKDLFTIILKIFGIYLIKDVIVALPPVLKFFLEIFQFDFDVAVFSLVVSLISLAINVIIVYFLLFKTDLIISKLNLTSDLSHNPLTLSVHRSVIYKIAIIVSGIIILVFAIPNLFRCIYFWYEHVDSKKHMYNSQSFEFAPLIVAIAEVIIGLLFLGNQRLIVNYIELRSRGSNRD